MQRKVLGVVVIIQTGHALVTYCVGTRRRIVHSRLSNLLVLSSRSLCILFQLFFLVQNGLQFVNHGILLQRSFGGPRYLECITGS